MGNIDKLNFHSLFLRLEENFPCCWVGPLKIFMFSNFLSALLNFMLLMIRSNQMERNRKLMHPCREVKFKKSFAIEFLMRENLFSPFFLSLCTKTSESEFFFRERWTHFSFWHFPFFNPGLCGFASLFWWQFNSIFRYISHKTPGRGFFLRHGGKEMRIFLFTVPLQRFRNEKGMLKKWGNLLKICLVSFLRELIQWLGF